MFTKIRQFITEVKIELSKVSWSTRQELIGATTVVILITMILAIFIGAADYLLSHALTFLIR